MSAISDKLKNIITEVLNAPRDDIDAKIDIIVKNTRLGKNEGDKVKKILDRIEETETKIEQVKQTIKTVNSVLQSLDAARKAAEATEKASTIGASLNPAAAAIAVAQKYVVETVKKEIKEAKDALNVVPKSIENFKSWIAESKIKLKKAQKEYKRKKALKEQRKRKLNS